MTHRLVCSFLVLTLFFVLQSAHAEKIELNEGEAIIIWGAIDAVEKRQTTIYSLNFKDINGTKSFNVDNSIFEKKGYKIVDSGTYYFSSVQTVFNNVVGIQNRPPEKADGRIAIKPDSVIYIGDWYVNGKLSGSKSSLKISTKFDLARVKELSERHEFLQNYPLYVATPDFKVLKVNWEELALIQ